MYTTGKLYEVEESSVRKIGGTIPIRFIGETVSITVYGSEQRPSSLSDMADISVDISPITSAGWQNFDALPRYIAFDGTVTDIEVSNLRLDEI
ncbi:MAG TPA: hypothetical protein VK982_14300, partial [Bacteroidales bacterium]|nr:hypothetical protein [Bacteroidales bacterium]